jgi:hypothetical protein
MAGMLAALMTKRHFDVAGKSRQCRSNKPEALNRDLNTPKLPSILYHRSALQAVNPPAA